MQVDTDRQSQWRDVLQKHVDAYKYNLKYNEDKLGGAYSGLISDFLVYDGNGSRQYLPATGYVREKDTDKNYHYNACRCDQHHSVTGWTLPIMYPCIHCMA